jgi:hypothetical protein
MQMKFFRYIKNSFDTLYIVCRVFRLMRLQQQFMQKTIQKEINFIKTENDGSLKESDFYKITNIYSLIVTGLFCELFCNLYGTKMTEKERLASTYQCALVGLFDDFFDANNGWNSDDLKKIIQNPADFKGENSRQVFFLTLVNKIHQLEGVYGRIMPHTKAVFHWQEQSILQINGNLDQNQLTEITKQKGVSSFSFLRSVLNHPITDDEYDFVQSLGLVFQLYDDIFDVYDDKESNIQTFMTDTKDIGKVKTMFFDSYIDAKVKLEKLPVAEKNKRFFNKILSVLYSTALVQLQQLQAAQKNNNNIFDLQKLTRKDLVCDMQKPKNYLRICLNYIIVHY